MSRGRNFTVAERAIKIVGVMAGVTLDEINRELEAEARRCGMAPRLMPQASYDMEATQYRNWIDQDRRRFWTHITRPHAIGDL